MKTILNNIRMIKPSTILIIFCNVLIFMFMQVLLFWYVISKAVEVIILDKSTTIKNIIKNSPRLQERLISYTQSNEYTNIKQLSSIDSNNRITYNIDLTWKWMLIPFLIIIIVIFLAIIYEIYLYKFTQYNNLKIDKTDLLVLITVFMSFFTEIIFIFVLVTRYIYISDMDMILFTLNSNIGYEIYSNYNQYTLSPYTLSPYTFPPL